MLQGLKCWPINDKMRIFAGFIVVLTALMLIFHVCPSLSQDKNPEGKSLLLRKAEQRKDTIVAVEAYIYGNILEMTVSARMHGSKPKIFNINIIGPKLGRLSPLARQMIFADAEEEDPFLTEDLEGGHIRFSKKIKEAKAKGTLTKELITFKIPPDKIVLGKEYKLWIKVEGMQGATTIETFKFDLEGLDKLVLQ